MPPDAVFLQAPRQEGTAVTVLLDLKSVMLVSVLLGVLISGALFAARSYAHGEARLSVTVWAMGMLSLPVGWVLILMRGVIPDVVSVPVGNAFSVLSYALFVHATRILARRAGVPWLAYGLVLLLLIGLTVDVLWLHAPRARLVGLSAVIAALLAYCTWEVIAGKWRESGAGAQLTAAAFGLGALILLVRIASELLFPDINHKAFDATPMQTVVYLYAAFGPVIASFGYVLMNNERIADELRVMAATDPLTGLFNRRPFEQLGEKLVADAVRKGRPLTLLMLDADHFKTINDSFGHGVGDTVLKQLAATLLEQLRSADLVGRLGGEEFAALLPDTAAAPALQVAERLRASVEDMTIQALGMPVMVRVSIGAAALDRIDVVSSDPAALFAELLRSADLAMYAAKRDGRNRVSTLQ